MRLLRIVIVLAVLLGAGFAQAQGTIEVGEEIEGVLSTEGEAAYQFTGQAGQFVRITLVSDDFDAYLRLEDASGNILAEDDDGAGSLNSRIGPFEIPQNGTYTIVATSLSGRDVGNYTLNLTGAEIQRIEYTQRVTGELTGSETQADFTFTAQAGDVVSIGLTSDDFDSYLTLSRSGTELTSNDDGGSGLNAHIGPYTLTETGDYVINVSAYNNEDGEYVLTLDRIDVIALAMGQTSKAEISGSRGIHFEFEGAAGQLVDVRVNSGDDLDTYLTLVGPDSYEIASDDDSGGRVDPALNDILLNQDGTYYISVQPNISRDAVTTLEVSLTESVIASLDDGPKALAFDESTTNQYVAFAGQADDQVILRLEMSADESLSPSVTVTQAGTQLAYVSYYNVVGEVSFGLRVPDDGLVTVQVTDYYGSADYTVSLER